MQTDPQITIRDVPSPEAVRSEIQDKISMLEEVYDRITSCRVNVDKQRAKGRKGHIFHVRIDLEVPNAHINVSHKPGDVDAHEDLHVAIRDSFNAARRRLKDYAIKTGGVHVKVHPELHYGRVDRLFPDEGYGFLRTQGGLEVYFQRDSVVGNVWDRLDLDSEVAFSLMDGDKGPFAVNVSLRD